MKLSLREAERIANQFLSSEYALRLCVPIKVNGRLKSVFGRLRYKGKTPLVIELSKDMLENQTREFCIDTLKHELIHYALFLLDKPYKDGQKYFENELKRLGVSRTGTGKYKGKVHVYKCKCMNHLRKRKLANDGQYYMCKRCREHLSYCGQKVV